ncbi:MAG: DinB family protein [Dehalococcoidia bacterium]|nr:DinB family protein [Dehalococcoidia bacterium]
MDARDLLRQQFREANEWLAATMQGVTTEQANWKPPGMANPLGATYAHALLSQDIIGNVVINSGAPLAATTWAGKTGLSEPPPTEDVAAWGQWARNVKVDLDALRAYGQAVQTAADGVIMSLTDADLDRAVQTPFGSSTVLFMLSGALIGHTHDHTGEIACLKGLQGAKGYMI